MAIDDGITVLLGVLTRDAILDVNTAPKIPLKADGPEAEFGLVANDG